MAFNPLPIVRQNLKRLMAKAGDDPETRNLSTQNGLAAACKLKGGAGQRTIGRILAGEQSPGLEVLQAIASVFELEVWVLLVPGLDPANPPVVLVTEAEKELHRRLQSVARDYVRTGEAVNDRDSHPTNADNHSAGTGSSKTRPIHSKTKLR